MQTVSGLNDAHCLRGSNGGVKQPQNRETVKKTVVFVDEPDIITYGIDVDASFDVLAYRCALVTGRRLMCQLGLLVEKHIIEARNDKLSGKMDYSVEFRLQSCRETQSCISDLICLVSNPHFSRSNIEMWTIGSKTLNNLIYGKKVKRHQRPRTTHQIFIASLKTHFDAVRWAHNIDSDSDE
jgi:hypothetical protein